MNSTALELVDGFDYSTSTTLRRTTAGMRDARNERMIPICACPHGVFSMEFSARSFSVSLG